MHVGILRRNDLLKSFCSLKSELIAGVQLGRERISFEVAPRVLRRQRERVQRTTSGNLHAHSDGIADGHVCRPGGGGHFEKVTLHPIVTLADISLAGKANEMHEQAHKKCFIANSVNFPVRHEGKFK